MPPLKGKGNEMEKYVEVCLKTKGRKSPKSRGGGVMYLIVNKGGWEGK